MAQSVKNLPKVEETQIQSLGQEDPLEEEMATHYHYCLQEEPHGLQSMGSQEELDTTEQLTYSHTHRRSYE